ncbi:MAG: MFS transporter [Firmicutes bacterium]|nr:MFS transporter [Bacillota bacterium]
MSDFAHTILGVILILAGWKSIPESLRWSLSHGDFQAAEQFIQHCESRVQQRLGGALPEIAVTTERIVMEEEKQHFTWGTLFRPPLFWFTILLFFIWFFNYFSVYGWNGVGVTLLVEQGYTLVHSIQMSIAGTIGGIVGALIAPQVTDRFPRKWPPFIVTLLLAAELFLLGFGPNNLLITLEFGLLAFQVGIFAPIVYLLTAEHFPTEGRNLGVAVTDGIGHIGGAIGPVAVTAIYGDLGFSAVFLAIGVSFILCAVLLLFTKRTNRQNLEEIVLEEVEGPSVSLQEND